MPSFRGIGDSASAPNKKKNQSSYNQQDDYLHQHKISPLIRHLAKWHVLLTDSNSPSALVNRQNEQVRGGGESGIRTHGGL